MTAVDQGPTRITVELPDEDYRIMKVAAAAGGRGASMSSLIRGLVHDYVERLQDETNIALVLERMQDTRPRLTGTEVADRLAAKRAGPQ
jgi:Arc/MetJ-type ribon-helix-helix transcriptional regulator